MNEKNKSIIALVVVIILIAFLVIIQAVSSEGTNRNTSYSGQYSEEYDIALTGEGKYVLLLGRDGCGWCQKFRPHINYLSSKYGFTYYYVDTDKLTTTELQSLLDRFGVEYSDFGTPYVAILDGGEKVGEIGGYVEEASLFTTLQNYGIISSDLEYEASETDASNEEESNTEKEDNSAYTHVSFSDYETYKAAYDKGDKMVIVLGQTGCGYCTSYKPVIDEVASLYPVSIHYLNLTEYSNTEAQDLISSLSSYFDGVESWGTPLTLIVENQTVVAAQKGSKDKDTLVTFLKDNGVIVE